MTDTDGNLVHAVVHTANTKDCDGAPLVLAENFKRFPWLRHVFTKVDMMATSSGMHCDIWANGPSRSSSYPIFQRASWVYCGAGQSDARWPRRNVTAALQGYEITPDSFESDPAAG